MHLALTRFLQMCREIQFLRYDMYVYDCYAVQGIDLVQQLIELGQEHLFDHWPAPGSTALPHLHQCSAVHQLCCLVGGLWAQTSLHALKINKKVHGSAGDDDDRKLALMEQLKQLNASYPGGLKAYITNAKHLLEGSKAGRLVHHKITSGHRQISL